MDLSAINPILFGAGFLVAATPLIFAAIGAIEWLTMARIVRGQTLSLRRREFVQAAESLGVSSGAILKRHIIPNTLGTVVIYMTLLIPRVILLESFLSSSRRHTLLDGGNSLEINAQNLGGEEIVRFCDDF